MEGKPIISIKDFAGSGAGGIWFNNGMVAHTDNGVSQMIEDFKQVKVFDNGDTGFTNALQVKKIIRLAPWNVAGEDIDFILCLDNEGYLHTSGLNASCIKGGNILERITNVSYHPDIYELPSGDLIYTRSAYLAKIIRGACHSDSTTSKIVDKDGRNFTTKGVGTGEKITNLLTGTTYTITGVTSENATNDAVTFDAGATENAENSDFITYDYDAFDLTSGLTIPQFRGQEQSPYWARQIKQFDDYWFILNGNFLAILDSDETTFDNNYKQLPTGHQAMGIEVNGDQIAVVSKDQFGVGYFLLWDGYSDGWLRINKIGGVANAVAAYENGFVYVVGGKIYYTDGYNTTILTEWNESNNVGDNDEMPEPYNFNSLVCVNGDVWFCNQNSNKNRTGAGIYYWKKDSGWGFMPTKYKTYNYYDTSYLGELYNINPYCIYWRTGDANRIEIGTTGGVNYISTDGASTASNDYKSFIYYVALPQNQQVKAVGLNVGVNPKYYSQSIDDASCKITVNIGDGRRGIIKYVNRVSVTGANTIKNDSYATSTADVGDELILASGTSGFLYAGERSFITNITNQGTASEAWTISPSLSAATAGGYIHAKLLKVKTTETKTILIGDINKEQMFLTKGEHIGNKLIIEVVVQGMTNSFPVSIQGINIYG